MTAEQQAPRRIARAQGPLETLGTVSQRTRVGHGARGLQPVRQRVGVLPARSRALARLSLERGRARRHLAIATRRSASRWRSGTSSDPILKERLFGLTGNEGNHGEDVKEYYFYLDSTPTHSYMKYLYKYPQRRSRMRSSSRRTAGAARATRNSSSSTRASSTTIATSTCWSSTPRQSRGHADAGSPSSTAGRRRRGCTCCRRLVPQHLVLGKHGRTALDAQPRTSTARSSRCASPSTARGGSHATHPRSCCSPRTRRTTGGCSARRTPARTSRTASTTTSSMARSTPSIPSRPARRPPRTTRSTIPAGDSVALRLRLTDSQADAASALTSTASSRARRRRPTSSTRRSFRRVSRPTPPTSCGRRSAACSGPSSSTTTS